MELVISDDSTVLVAILEVYDAEPVEHALVIEANVGLLVVEHEHAETIGNVVQTVAHVVTVFVDLDVLQ